MTLFEFVGKGLRMASKSCASSTPATVGILSSPYFCTLYRYDSQSQTRYIVPGQEALVLLAALAGSVLWPPADSVLTWNPIVTHVEASSNPHDVWDHASMQVNCITLSKIRSKYIARSHRAVLLASTESHRQIFISRACNANTQSETSRGLFRPVCPINDWLSS